MNERGPHVLIHGLLRHVSAFIYGDLEAFRIKLHAEYTNVQSNNILCMQCTAGSSNVKEHDTVSLDTHCVPRNCSLVSSCVLFATRSMARVYSLCNVVRTACGWPYIMVETCRSKAWVEVEDTCVADCDVLCRN